MAGAENQFASNVEVNTDLPRESLKRKLGIEETSMKKPKLDKLELSKSPLQYLNTILPIAPVFTVEHVDGPIHDPLFSATVEVAGRTFRSFGRNKQHAKQMTSLEVLKVVLNNPNLTYEGAEKNFTPPEKEVPNIPCPAELAGIAGNDDSSKTPVQLLNEIHPNATFQLVKEDTKAASHRFVIELNIHGVRYRGYGANKKKAKHAAARTALSAMSTPFRQTMSLVDSTFASIPQTLSDAITQAVLDKYESVLAVRPEKKPWKVLAGLVATYGYGGAPEVLCLTTGTKCIGGMFLSMSGNALFDCHGEVLARRCFKYICYSELLRLRETLSLDRQQSETNTPRILELDPISKRVRLATHVKLHLFISTAPCGDGRLFAPNEDACKTVDEGSKKLSRGLLRTKIEGGEGTVRIHGDNVIQTWDGIMNGEQRLLTHSCSDKILRWNILGLQGSLLSKFISPVYLSSIVLGSLYHPEHLSRALVDRIAQIRENSYLPANYYLNEPNLTKASSTLERQITKTPSHALNWIFGDQMPEIINATTGIQENGLSSRLSKKMLFKRYAQVVTAWNPQIRLENLTYMEAKRNAMEYQAAKQCLLQELKLLGLGAWVKKPEECETFLIQERFS